MHALTESTLLNASGMSKNSYAAERQHGIASASGGPVNPSSGSNSSQQQSQNQSYAQQSAQQHLTDTQQAPTQWKRRCREELDRSYRCREPECTRRYEAWRSLQRHLKVDHNLKTRKAEYIGPDEDQIIAAPESHTSVTSSSRNSSNTGSGGVVKHDARKDGSTSPPSSPESGQQVAQAKAPSLDSFVDLPLAGLLGDQDVVLPDASTVTSAGLESAVFHGELAGNDVTSFYTLNAQESESSTINTTTTTTTTVTTTSTSYETDTQQGEVAHATSQAQRKGSAVILNASRPLAMRKPLLHQERRRMSPPYSVLGVSATRMGSNTGAEGDRISPQQHSRANSMDMSSSGAVLDNNQTSPAFFSSGSVPTTSPLRTKSDSHATIAAKKKAAAAAAQRRIQQDTQHTTNTTQMPPTTPAQPPALPGVNTMLAALSDPATIHSLTSPMYNAEALSQLSLVRHNSSPPRLLQQQQQQQFQQQHHQQQQHMQAYQQQQQQQQQQHAQAARAPSSPFPAFSALPTPRAATGLAGGMYAATTTSSTSTTTTTGTHQQHFQQQGIAPGIGAPRHLDDNDLDMLLRFATPQPPFPPGPSPWHPQAQFQQQQQQQPPRPPSEQSMFGGPHGNIAQGQPPRHPSTGAPQRVLSRARSTGMTVTPPSAVASAVVLQQAGGPRYTDASGLRTFLPGQFMPPITPRTPAGATLSMGSVTHSAATDTNNTPATSLSSPAYMPAMPPGAPHPSTYARMGNMLYSAPLFSQQLSAGTSTESGVLTPGQQHVETVTAVAQAHTQAQGQRALYSTWPAHDDMIGGLPTVPDVTMYPQFAAAGMLGVSGLWGQFPGAQMQPQQQLQGQQRQQNDGERSNQ